MDDTNNGHHALINSRLPLAEIEKRLREQGYDQEAIDSVLAFVMKAREALAKKLAQEESEPN